MDMTLEIADKAIKAAFAKSTEQGTAMGITVVDKSGRLVMSARADDSGFYTFDTSYAKAITAAAYKRSTKDMVENRSVNPHFFDALPGVIPGGVLPTSGAVPIHNNGKIIGAIGIGGGRPDQDNECAIVGANAVESS